MSDSDAVDDDSADGSVGVLQSLLLWIKATTKMVCCALYFSLEQANLVEHFNIAAINKACGIELYMCCVRCAIHILCVYTYVRIYHIVKIYIFSDLLLPNILY